MRHDAIRLSKLAELTEAEFQAKRSGMARLTARDAAIRALLADIEADHRAQSGALTVDDSFVRAGAALQWETWVDARRSALNRELARVRAEIEAAKADLARSFGRNYALTELIGRTAKADRVVAQRRQDSGS